ncbi:hypothetical protein [Mycoplasma todarodis]|uniref:Lipoprotein n=1 Tax=Mycoplasma todarodis TaxID=1937191 RepID=A0A4R0XQ46_9MOLU|nr:hypothetical protein [Mycoplasma todarodis]TCG10995.1 hypothetical protein C4B25_02535 [Mycoplasma todarodis]
MNLNKKTLLRSAIVPLVISVPTVVAVSCGTSITTTQKQEKNKSATNTITEQKAYATAPMLQLNQYFQEFASKIKTNNSPSLAEQVTKTKDSAIIAFLGYIESDGTKPNASKKAIKKAKEEFAKNIEQLKIDLNKLFDMAIGDPKSSTNLLSPLLKNLIQNNLNDKDGKINKFGTIVIENVLKKIKMVMNNILDTMINIEHSQKPDFFNTKNNIKEIGSIKAIQDRKVKSKTPNVTFKQINAAFQKGFTPEELFKHDSKGDYNILHNLGFFTKLGAETLLGDMKFKKPNQELKGSAWQIGVQKLQKEINSHPENVMVYENTKNHELLLKLKTTTTVLANEIKSKLKFNEEHINSLLDDNLISKIIPLLKKVMNGIGMGDLLWLKGQVSAILKDKKSIYTFLNRMELILEDFGKTLQLTELNLQMIISKLLGDNAEYYGGLTKTNANTYKLNPKEFTTPQFNVYKYENYKPYNETISDEQINKEGLKVTASLGFNLGTFNVLEIFKNITRDPLSNYTVGLFQIAQLLTKDMKDMKVGI